MIELAQLRRSGQVTRTVDTPQRPSQLGHGKRDPKKTPTDLQKILKERGTKWKAVRATARARDRWTVVRKPSTPTGRRGSTKWRVKRKTVENNRFSTRPPDFASIKSLHI
jgi:hypothetical protein